MDIEPTLETVFGREYAAEKEIRGAVYTLDAAEEAALWEDFEVLCPGAQTRWLRHFMALEFHLSRLQAGWIPATPSLTWRIGLPYFLFEDMQHVKNLRIRFEEYSKTSLSLELPPRLEKLLRTIAGADSAASFYRQLFAQIKPAILAAYRTYLGKCDEIADAPTVYLLTHIIQDKERQLAKAREIFEADPLTAPDPAAAALYTDHVRNCLAVIGSLTPEFSEEPAMPANPVKKPAGPAPDMEIHDPRLRRTKHFPQTVEESPLRGTLREIVYHMATEWQVVAPMCYAYVELTRMPLEFFIDFSRHIWDECRHAQIGHRRLRELGFTADQFIWPTPDGRPESVQEYVAMLTLVGETCSFKRKQGSIAPFLRAGDQRSALLPSIDCVDERMHVTYGSRWVPEIYKRYKNDERPLREIAAEVRSQVLVAGNLLKENDSLRNQVSNKLPLFCSATEFSSLNFTKY